MKLLALAAIFAAICAQTKGQGFLNNINLVKPIGLFKPANKPCGRDLTLQFRDALNEFAMRLTKRASYYSKNHFIMSPYTIWLSLASLAEYADANEQLKMFTALNLPLQKCSRDQYYQLALNLEVPGNDIKFDRSRVLAIDDRAAINEDWISFSNASNILKCISISFEPETFQTIYETMGIVSAEKVAYGGHSLLLDRLEYDGLWTTAFSAGTVERAPFYNELGQQIAMVDYMKMTDRVRLAHIPIIDAKALELPVGFDGRYTMLLTMGIKNTTIQKILDLLRSSIILRIMSALSLSLVPLEVVIPRFSMSNAFDARPLLEDMGFGNVFSDPAATRDVSDPPAQPFSYLQRVAVNLTSGSLQTGSGSSNILHHNVASGFFGIASDTATGLASAVGRNFIANRPFLLTLIDTKTQVPIFTGVYSFPEDLGS